MTFTRFSPGTLGAMNGFMERAISPQFAKRVAAAMHTKLMLDLDPDTFSSVYEDVSKAATVDDLSATSRKLLRQAIAEMEQRTWGPEQESLHPREHGRFAHKPGVGAIADAVGDLDSAISGLLGSARKRDKTLTPLLREAAKGSGGRLEGLSARLHTSDSFAQKVKRLKDKMPGASEAEIAHALPTLRYQTVLPHDGYAAGVRSTIAAMEQRGFNLAKLDNHWSPGTHFTGMEGVFQGSDGSRFSMGFHTEESLAARRALGVLNDHFGRSQNPHERRVLFGRMVDEANRVQIPDGAQGIGTLRSMPTPPDVANAAQAAADAAPDVNAPHSHIVSEAGLRGETVHGIKPDPHGVYHVGDDVNKAALLLSEGHHVSLNQPRQVSTLVDKLAKWVNDAEARGDKAPNFDLCKVSVKGTNLFCAESKGIPRVQMPQLKGFPDKGTRADALPRDVRGEVDLMPHFVESLKQKGVGIRKDKENASYLRATQRELNGGKVAGIQGFLEGGGNIDGDLMVTEDNYVVDGHHRWAAVVGKDARDNNLENDPPMDVLRIDMNIIDLLAASNQFAAEWGIPNAGFSAGFGAPGPGKTVSVNGKTITLAAVEPCEDC